jgi:hypothetical protein
MLMRRLHHRRRNRGDRRAHRHRGQCALLLLQQPNPNGDAGRAGSKGFVSFGVIAASEGFCPAGAEVLADAVGVTTSTLINAHGVMAGPTDGNRAISHLDFAALEAAIPAATAACG